mmetsp:Transcript_21814/g.39407  ORF Transcript_21814/g.39407 Transcript_21814/m.39407 type:complete len:200 (+) Transcript_21814:618-1217(+)
MWIIDRKSILVQTCLCVKHGLIFGIIITALDTRFQFVVVEMLVTNVGCVLVFDRQIAQRPLTHSPWFGNELFPFSVKIAIVIQVIGGMVGDVSHGFRPFIGVSKLCQHESRKVFLIIIVLKPMLPTQQPGLDFHLRKAPDQLVGNPPSPCIPFSQNCNAIHLRRRCPLPSRLFLHDRPCCQLCGRLYRCMFIFLRLGGG